MPPEDSSAGARIRYQASAAILKCIKRWRFQDLVSDCAHTLHMVQDDLAIRHTWEYARRQSAPKGFCSRACLFFFFSFFGVGPEQNPIQKPGGQNVGPKYEAAGHMQITTTWEVDRPPLSTSATTGITKPPVRRRQR